MRLGRGERRRAKQQRAIERLQRGVVEHEIQSPLPAQLTRLRAEPVPARAGQSDGREG